MIITSKYSGRCTTCGGAIEAGERVSWVKGVKGAKHAACSDEGRELERKVETSRAVDADVDVPAPEGLDYLPYQRAGIAYALGRVGTLIGDEMGLGKTIQAIGLINADPSIQSVLVICPASLKVNWARELRKWLVRKATITVINGKTQVVSTGGELAVTIANYDVLKKHKESLAREWDLVVADEVHYIKNARAQRTKLVLEIARAAKRRIGLTGTPIANRPVELWPVLQFVDPATWDPAGKKKGKDVKQGSGAGFFRFAKRFCDAHDNGYGWDFSGSANLPELQDKLRASCMVRRLKKDVLKELPPKQRQVIELPGGARAVKAEQKAWNDHEAELTELAAKVELARAGTADEYAAAVAQLKEHAKVAFSEMAKVRHDTVLAKLPLCIEHVRETLESTDKVVVFAHHHDAVDALAEAFGDEAVTLTGRDSQDHRQAAVDRFQEDPTCKVFIGSIQAAGVGLTLTAASHVVFVELDWVPANVSQAEDRLHRIGQHDNVLVQHLVLEGSIDARMANVLVEKQRVADLALDTEVKTEPVVPSAGKAATANTRRAELDKVAESLSADDIERIHDALRALAGMCDGAQELDGAGFSKIDVRIGHELAGQSKLTPRQAALGAKLCRKYHRQVGDVLTAA